MLRIPTIRFPVWNGHSVGHWEGDTLVVDTIGFNDKSWLFGCMDPHTEEAHLIERIRSVSSGADKGPFLGINLTVEDRHALTSAYTYNRYYKKQAATAGDGGGCLQRGSRDVEADRDAASRRRVTSCQRNEDTCMVARSCRRRRAARGATGFTRCVINPFRTGRRFREGLKNSGSPNSIELLPGMQIIHAKDPWKMCQPVSPSG